VVGAEMILAIALLLLAANSPTEPASKQTLVAQELES